VLDRRERRLLAAGMALAIMGNVAVLTIVPPAMWAGNVTSALLCLGALVLLIRRKGI
jgi:hypothetical protein